MADLTIEDVITDERKKFLLSTAGNYFQITIPPEEEKGLEKNECLNDFLEDTGCFILSVKSLLNSKLSLENKLPPGEGKEIVLVFFKIRPEVVTPESIRDLVFVVSMPDSPIVALYHTLQRIFAPTLLKDDCWSQNVEPKLQTMLSDLETGLRNVVLRTQDENITPSASLSEIMSVDDELHFWRGCAKYAKKKSEQEKSKAFVDALEPLANSLRELDAMEVADAEDLLETAYNTLDDLWKLDEYRYPQSRMEHLMEIIGKTLTSFIQLKLKPENIWEGDFIEVEAMLSQCISMCSKWVQTCEKLTTLYWPNHSLHRWAGLPYRPVHITRFCDRLKQILNLRTVDRQLTKLLSPNEQAQLDVSSNFKPFSNVNAVQYNPYTEPQWQAVVRRYEQHIRPAEERVAAKLKHQLCNSNLNTLQLMEEFKRYQEIIQRPSIQRDLVAERENLLSKLQDYVAGAQVEASDTQLRLVDMPPVVARLSWARQLEAKVLEIEKLSGAVLNDLNGYPGLRRALDHLKKELKDYLTEQFDMWTRDTGAAIKNRTLGLKTDEPVVHFEQGKLMHVNYNPGLVGLVQQVRQMAVMGYNVPSHIADAAELARQFMKQARALQQVATFHNTIGDRMIASQRPMMLAAAVELARLVREQHNVTWSNTTAVDTYITKLQGVVDRLYKENNQLAHYHNQITDKVVTLMSTDLLRHQQLWKEGLREIRDLMAHVETQFSNTKSWRVHWDHQLYKALEHQYQLGLEALNQHMPEIRVDIVYR